MFFEVNIITISSSPHCISWWRKTVWMSWNIYDFIEYYDIFLDSSPARPYDTLTIQHRRTRKLLRTAVSVVVVLLTWTLDITGVVLPRVLALTGRNKPFFFAVSRHPLIRSPCIIRALQEELFRQTRPGEQNARKGAVHIQDLWGACTEIIIKIQIHSSCEIEYFVETIFYQYILYYSVCRWHGRKG